MRIRALVLSPGSALADVFDALVRQGLDADERGVVVAARRRWRLVTFLRVGGRVALVSAQQDGSANSAALRRAAAAAGKFALEQLAVARG